MRRCALREELLARGCPPEELEEPRGRQEVLQDEPLSQGTRGEGATQLAPQRVRVTLRPGELGSGGPPAPGLGWDSTAPHRPPHYLHPQESPSSSGSASFEPRDTLWTCTTLWT